MNEKVEEGTLLAPKMWEKIPVALFLISASVGLSLATGHYTNLKLLDCSVGYILKCLLYNI